jgi:hypothetical protein
MYYHRKVGDVERMPIIYDNQEKILTKGLNEALARSKWADFCVDYFNLRRWKEVSASVDAICGETIFEGRDCENDNQWT